MAVRSNTDSALDEELTEDKEGEGWAIDEEPSDVAVSDEQSHQERLDRHALVFHGKQLAAVQGQLAQVVGEMGALRRLCVSARGHTKKTNAMLETLGKHLGVQLNIDHLDVEDLAG